MQVAPIGQVVLLQVAEHVPPGKPVLWPKIVSGMQTPFVGGLHWLSVAQAAPI